MYLQESAQDRKSFACAHHTTRTTKRHGHTTSTNACEPGSSPDLPIVRSGGVITPDSLASHPIKDAIARKTGETPIAVFHRGACALRSLLAKPVGFLVVGLNLPDWDGLDVATAVHRLGVAQRIVLCVDRSNLRDFELLQRSERRPWQACMHVTHDSPDEIAAATLITTPAPIHIGAGLRRHWQRRIGQDRDYQRMLTPAQVRFLAYSGSGLDDSMIADQLAISVHTARSHRKSVMWKLDLHSQAELMAYAAAHGLVRFTEERTLRPGFDADRVLEHIAQASV